MKAIKKTAGSDIFNFLLSLVSSTSFETTVSAAKKALQIAELLRKAGASDWVRGPQVGKRLPLFSPFLCVVNKNNSQDLGGFVFLGLLALIKWDDPGNNPDKPAGARVPRRQGSHMTHMIHHMIMFMFY